MQYIATPLRHLFRLARLQDEDLRRRAAVLNVLLFTTLVVLCLAVASVLLSYMTGAQHAPAHRLLSVGAATGVTAILYTLLRRGHYFIPAYGVLIIYGSIATVMAMQWSINLPGVSLLYCIVIVLAGIVLGAGYALYAAFLSAGLLFIIESAIVRGSLHPNVSWYQTSPHMTDLAVYYLVFIVLGVSTWLFNRQTDTALHRALRAESALQREKTKLALQVEVRTRELEAAQLEKMEQLYRFAQLGQFSTGLLHDLSNHMSTLSLDIQGFAEQHKHTQLQARITRRIQYIDNMVHWANENINGTIRPKSFSVMQEINEIFKIFQYEAGRAHVQLHASNETDAPLRLYGDPNRFRQLVANLICNAVDAYKDAPMESKREVGVAAGRNDDGAIVISVYDFGVALPEGAQNKVFEPFYSTKHAGIGIGLFAVRQIAEEHFQGSVSAQTKDGETRFTAVLKGMKRDA